MMREKTILRIGVSLFKRVQGVPVSFAALNREIVNNPEQQPILDRMIFKAEQRGILFRHGNAISRKQRAFPNGIRI